ncbi:MAG: hypothetical protein JWO36_144, partial [Myxococcales bacterium]|nr:hypothetical protein [Myxococcales bacterium]
TTGPMTVTGTVLGTPAYMAPEQYAGSEVDGRSDQFSFCVAAWESLFGARPFAGTTLPQLQQAIERGEIETPDGSAVPTSIRRVLVRGLAPKPEARWPDIPTLMTALRGAARPRRRRWVIAAAIAAGITLAGGIWTVGRSSEVSCNGAGADIDQLFPIALRSKAIAMARANSGDEIAERIAHNLERFVTSYRGVAGVACRAVRDHQWSDDLADRSRDCREEQARNFVTVLEGELEEGRVGKALVLATADYVTVADFGSCREPNVLAAMPTWPADERRSLIEARAQLVNARELAGRGQVARAQAAVAKIVGSPIGSSPRLAGSLAVVRGTIAHVNDDYPTAIREMTDAYYKAHSNVDLVVEIEALRYLLYFIGVDKQDSAGVESWYRLALSEVDRYHRVSPLRSAELRLALVGVAVTRGELPVALEQARLADASVDDSTPLLKANARREYASALAETGDHVRAIPAYEQTVKLVASALGPYDSQLAELLGDEALTLSEAGRSDEAVKVIEHAQTILLKNPDYGGADRGTLELNFATVFLAAGQRDRAEPLLRSARDRRIKALGPDDPTIGTIDANLAQIATTRGNFDQAIPLLQAALASQTKAVGADHPEVANTLYHLAEALAAKLDWLGALASVHRCLEIRAARLPNSDFYVDALLLQAEIENLAGRPESAFGDASKALELPAPRGNYDLTARAKLEQARALFALRRDEAMARRVLGEARAMYVAHDRPNQVADIDALAAQHR